MAMEDQQGTTGQKRAGVGADADSGVVVEPQSPDDTQPQSHADPDPSPKGTPARCSEANENASHTTNTNRAKDSGVSEGVVDTPKEVRHSHLTNYNRHHIVHISIQHNLDPLGTYFTCLLICVYTHT